MCCREYHDYLQKIYNDSIQDLRHRFHLEEMNEKLQRLELKEAEQQEATRKLKDEFERLAN